MDPYVLKIMSSSLSDAEKISILREDIINQCRGVNLLAGSDPITISILKTIMTNNIILSPRRQFMENKLLDYDVRMFFVDVEDAACKECVEAGHCGQGKVDRWAKARARWDEWMDGYWHDPGGEVVCPDSHNCEFKKVATLLGPVLMKLVCSITLTICSKQPVDMAILSSALQNIRRYVPNPQAITITHNCSCVPNTDWELAWGNGEGPTVSAAANGPSGLPIMPVSNRQSDHHESFPAAPSSVLNRTLSIIEEKDGKLSISEKYTPEIFDVSIRGSMEKRPFSPPKSPIIIPQPEEIEFLEGRQGNSTAGEGKYDTLKRRRGKDRSSTGQPKICRETVAEDTTGRRLEELEKVFTKPTTGLNHTLQQAPISEKCIDHHHVRRRTNEGISAHDFAYELQSSHLCLSKLLPLKWQEKLSEIKNALIQRMLEAHLQMAQEREAEEARWKVKIMIWRLEGCLPAGKRIEFHGRLWGDRPGDYLMELWLEGGRRWWQ